MCNNNKNVLMFSNVFKEEPDYWRHFQKREALDTVEDSGPETKVVFAPNKMIRTKVVFTPHMSIKHKVMFSFDAHICCL